MQDDGSGKAGMLREGAMDIPISQADTVRLFAHLIERVQYLEWQMQLFDEYIRVQSGGDNGRHHPEQTE
jgi:hypothetical protein